MPGLFSYVVSKAGLWGMTQQVAVEYLLDGITCNMIAPGWVDTPNERRIQAQHGRPDFPAGIRNLTTPDEIGAAVVYLARAGDPGFAPESSNEEIARVVRSASGPSGDNESYVLRLAQALRELGEDDPHVFEIERLLRRMP